MIFRFRRQHDRQTEKVLGRGAQAGHMSKTIWIPGQPSRVTHQSGTRYANRRTYKTAPLIGWEKTLMRALEPEAPEKPYEGPIFLSVTFGYRAKTKKQQFTWKTTRPDTDNIVKTVKDVMTEAGYWKDDAQICWEECKKMWVDEPGIRISYDTWPPLPESEDWPK